MTHRGGDEPGTTTLTQVSRESGVGSGEVTDDGATGGRLKLKSALGPRKNLGLPDEDTVQSLSFLSRVSLTPTRHEKRPPDVRLHHPTQGEATRHKERPPDARRNHPTKGETSRHKERPPDARRDHPTQGETGSRSGHTLRYNRDTTVGLM